jgi:ATP:corrinoid adenosyltransferase
LTPGGKLTILRAGSNPAWASSLPITIYDLEVIGECMDIEATMQFILDQQAQFSSDVARIHSILSDVAERQNKSEQIIQEVRQTMLDVANAQERTNEILATLAERQVATDEILTTLAQRQIATEEAISRLAERQATTEENLNVLLLTVERHIAGHN